MTTLPINAAVAVAGCITANAVHAKARHRILEYRYERRAAKIRNIVTDRLHLDPEDLKHKYGPNVTSLT